jgi:hypothetical protein
MTRAPDAMQCVALLRSAGAMSNAGACEGPGSAEQPKNAAPRPGHGVSYSLTP